MRYPIRHLDAGTLAIICLTLVLFVVALFLKGLTHDLLLEAGVFLVSVKLILLSFHIHTDTESIQNKLDQIHELVRRMEGGGSSGPP